MWPCKSSPASFPLLAAPQHSHHSRAGSITCPPSSISNNWKRFLLRVSSMKLLLMEPICVPVPGLSVHTHGPQWSSNHALTQWVSHLSSGSITCRAQHTQVHHWAQAQNLWFQDLGWGPKTCISKKLAGDAALADLGTPTLRKEGIITPT